MIGYTSGITATKICYPAADGARVDLPPGGWLQGVLVRPLDRHSGIRCELTDSNLVGLWGQFTVPSYMTQHGMMLDEPVPNMNSSCPYVLRILGPHPAVEITIINRDHDHGSK